MENQIANYLESIGFTDPVKMTNLYIDYLKLPGNTDSLGLIDPHEIAHIRSIMKSYA